MRLWSLRPHYLDGKGLVALWREALLAQKVLADKTIGYKNHPQLIRFKHHPDPAGAIGAYLHAVYQESLTRGYTFDCTKIKSHITTILIQVTTGQINYEFNHLCKKLSVRSPEHHAKICTPSAQAVLPHPLFVCIDGPVASWEQVP